MLTIRDYEGTEYPLLAVKKHKSELNGTEDLALTVHQQSNNSLDLKQIDKLWEIDYQNITFKIVHIQRKTRGNSFYLEIRAKPLFYWDFDKQIIHENHDGSHTANSAFRTVFEGSGYNFTIVDFSPSVTIEGFGKGSTRMELFKRLLDRYNYEFYISGSTVYLRHLIGNDTNFMYKYKLNASNISENIDADGMFTHIKGFGNFEEGEEDYWNNAQLKREYTSPLADIVGHYEGPPIVDGRMTQQSTLDAAMQKAVEESLQVTVEGTLHDIRQMGYDIAVPLKGDRVWLMDERIDLEQEIRVYSVETTYDEKDNIIDCQVAFGSQSIRDRHKSNLTSVAKDFKDLINGRGDNFVPVVNLDQMGREMIRTLHDTTSELRFGDFGIQAVDKSNPNNVLGINSSGWYISTDGGRTPRTIATADGITANAIYTGTLKGIILEGNEVYGGRLHSLNNNTQFNLNTGVLTMERATFNLSNGADIQFHDAGNRIYYNRNNWGAGLAVGTSINDTYPFVAMGVSDGNKPHATDVSNFSGFIANSNDRERVDDIGNSAVGNRFHVRDHAISFSKGFLFNVENTFFSPMNSGTHDYSLGTPNNRWREIHGTMSSTSVHNSKMNIEDMSAKAAYDYATMMKVKTYFYKDDDFTDKYNRKVSPILEQLDPANEHLYKSSQDALDLGSNLFLLYQAFQHHVDDNNNRLEELEYAIRCRESRE